MGSIVLDVNIVPTEDSAEALRFCQELALGLRNKTVEIQKEPISQTDLSIVIAVYNETQTIAELYSRLKSVLQELDMTVELLFVDDGSTDDTFSKLEELSRGDSFVGVVHLGRNFGHQVALSAGLDYSTGNATVIMDADLQDLPEVIPQFVEKWKSGYEVVYAVRTKRKEGIVLRFAYKCFYRILNLVAEIDIPLDTGDFCLMDRRVVELIRRMPERKRFLRGIRSWVGFRQVGIAVERDARFAGKPKYSILKLVYLALDGFFSFSYKPLRFISLLGVCISGLSIGLGMFYLVQKLTVGLNPAGFATITVLLCFFAGVQLITLGLIGEYLGRVFEEVKGRPLYTVRALKGLRFAMEEHFES